MVGCDHRICLNRELAICITRGYIVDPSYVQHINPVRIDFTFSRFVNRLSRLVDLSKAFSTPTNNRISKVYDYGGEHVFLLEGNIGAAQGTVIELKRFYAGVEVAIALVEIMEKNSKGQYQARPIWISPGHLRDLKMGQFVYSEIEAEPLVKLRTLKKAKDQIIQYGDSHE